MSRVRSLGPVVLAVLIALVAGTPRPGAAEMPWSLALKSEGEILAAVSGLSAEAPGSAEAAAVALLSEVAWEVRPGDRVLYRNTVVRVNDVEQLGLVTAGFYLDARGETVTVEGFRIRDGVVTRHEIKVTRGDGAVRRTHISIDVSDVMPGDILGLSSITRFDNILYFNTVPIGSRFPVANFSLRIHVAKNHMYKIQAENFDRLEVETVGFQDAQPNEWHATAQAIPAIADFRGAGPFEADTPLALIAESAEWVPAANSWMSTLAWPRVALYLSGMRELSMSTMIGAAQKTQAVIAGQTTAVQKEAAIFRFVRDELELLAGDAYDPLGYRSANEIFEEGAATPFEKVMIMVSMLGAAKLSGEIGVVRTGDFGPLDPDLKSFVQFQDVVVRCGDDSPRFYVPYEADAPEGALPGAWGKCSVLTPAPGLMQKLSAASAKIMSTPNVDAHSAFLQVREEAAEKGWFHLEEVGD